MRALRFGVHTFKNRLIFGAISLLFLIALVATLAGYALGQTRLSLQQNAQLETAKSAVSYLLTAEQNRIRNQLALFSERPSLQGLLATQQAAELRLYIQDFRSQSGLDFLAVYQANGELMASNGRLNSYSLAAGQGFLLQDGRALLVMQQIIVTPGSDLPLGTAVAGVWLERPFLDSVGAVTGTQLRLFSTTESATAGSASLPLLNSTGQITLLVQITLPNSEPASHLPWVLWIGGIAVGLTLLSGLLWWLFVGRQTATLQNLSTAAQRIGQGNFAAPLPLVSVPTEVRHLATALHRLQAEWLIATQQLEPAETEVPEQEAPPGTWQMSAPGFVFDKSRLEIQRNGEEPVRLTPLEGRLLESLMRNAGQVMSSELLITAVWGSDGGDRTMLKQLVYRLRSKIDPHNATPSSIETIPGAGYTFKN